MGNVRKFVKCYVDERYKIVICFDYILSKIFEKFYFLKFLICIIRVENIR